MKLSKPKHKLGDVVVVPLGEFKQFQQGYIWAAFYNDGWHYWVVDYKKELTKENWLFKEKEIVYKL